MKVFFLIGGLLLILILLVFIGLAISSQKSSDHLGLHDGVLQRCPDSPNCVCSELHSQGSEMHAIAPIKSTDWQRLVAVIEDKGGVIEQQDGHYLHATFSTPLFHFVDDLELRNDANMGVIHFRSASRVGHSDFGVNRKRIVSIITANKQ
ncbi:MAG: DUF1499 domain-containing protein [Mariprofundus sp.]|nr:DUF1499 domain-containing protein [Mariprofundus sp.]